MADLSSIILGTKASYKPIESKQSDRLAEAAYQQNLAEAKRKREAAQSRARILMDTNPEFLPDNARNAFQNQLSELNKKVSSGELDPDSMEYAMELNRYKTRFDTFKKVWDANKASFMSMQSNPDQYIVRTAGADGSQVNRTNEMTSELYDLLYGESGKSVDVPDMVAQFEQGLSAVREYKPVDFAKMNADIINYVKQFASKTDPEVTFTGDDQVLSWMENLNESQKQALADGINSQYMNPVLDYLTQVDKTRAVTVDDAKQFISALITGKRDWTSKTSIAAQEASQKRIITYTTDERIRQAEREAELKGVDPADNDQANSYTIRDLSKWPQASESEEALSGSAYMTQTDGDIEINFPADPSSRRSGPKSYTKAKVTNLIKTEDGSMYYRVVAGNTPYIKKLDEKNAEQVNKLKNAIGDREYARFKNTNYAKSSSGKTTFKVNGNNGLSEADRAMEGL